MARSFAHALTHATFNVVSIVTTTGFASADYTLWGPLTGCAPVDGDISGRMLRLHIRRHQGLPAGHHRKLGALRPDAADLSQRDPAGALWLGCGRTGHAAHGVSLRLRLYGNLGTWMRVALSATGLDIETALSGSITALANVGPGIGPQIGPSGNFSSIGDAGKMIMVFLDAAWPSGNSCGSGIAVPAFWRELIEQPFNTAKLSFLVSH
jgi:trk system potassium uptake protein TrkH